MSAITRSFALARLLRNARRSPAELAPIIAGQLKRVLVAATKVPRHRETMRRAGYDPSRDFGGLNDLAIMPVMTKADLKRAPDEFLRAGTADRLHACFRDRTSGSTGMPLTVYRSSRERDIQIAKWLRVLMLNGYRPTDKVLSFTSPGRLDEGRSVLQRFGLFRRKAVDYTLPPEVLADELLRYLPDVVYGVRTSLLQVAEELARRGIVMDCVKLLVAGGEVIDARARQRCREAFGVDISESYGTVEMGVMAYQKRGEHHLTLIEDCTLFEFLDTQGKPARPGELARIVVTDLHGGLMPFIRYDQGDLAIFSLRQNEQGETTRVIEHVVGRQDDLCRLPNGQTLTYLDFYEIMDIYVGVKRFRIRHVAATRFVIEVVADREYFLAIQVDLLSNLKAMSRLPLIFDFCLKECIEPDPSGKLRMLASEVRT